MLPSRAWAGRWRRLALMAAAPEPHETEKKVMFAVGHAEGKVNRRATRFPRPIPMAVRCISDLVLISQLCLNCHLTSEEQACRIRKRRLIQTLALHCTYLIERASRRVMSNLYT